MLKYVSLQAHDHKFNWLRHVVLGDVVSIWCYQHLKTVCVVRLNFRGLSLVHMTLVHMGAGHRNILLAGLQQFWTQARPIIFLTLLAYIFDNSLSWQARAFTDAWMRSQRHAEYVFQVSKFLVFHYTLLQCQQSIVLLDCSKTMMQFAFIEFIHQDIVCVSVESFCSELM